jgi:hypothetical protein
MGELQRAMAAPPGRHFNPGFSQVEIGRETAHALNLRRHLSEHEFEKALRK